MISNPVRFSILGWGCLFAIFVTAAIIQANVLVNHDSAWILQGAERILNGAEFGRDIIDVNPPLVWWIKVPVIFAGNWLGQEIGFTFKIWVFTLIGLSLILCWFLLRQSPNSPNFGSSIICISAAVLFIGPGYDFGQREHLMVILALPYIITISHKANGDTLPLALCIISGLMAGLAFCLKPQFLIIPILLGLWQVFLHRRFTALFSAENLSMALIGFGYLGAIIIFAPDYIWKVVPDASVGYLSYNNPLGAVLKSHVIALMPLILVLLLLIFSAKRVQKLNHLFFAFIIAAGGATLASIIQLKGWSYHLFPGLSFFFIALSCILIQNMTLKGLKNKTIYVLGAVISLVVFAIPIEKQWTDLHSKTGTAAVSKRLVELFRHHRKDGEFVFSFITSPRAVHTAVLEADMNWSSLACCLHLLPAIVKETPKTSDPKKRLLQIAAANAQIDQVLADLRKRKPNLIIIDDAQFKLGFGRVSFDYIDWLNENRPKLWAKFWVNYHELNRIGPFRIFKRQV